MGRRRKKDILTGIELGTAYVKVAMGEFLPSEVVSIIGAAQVSSLHKVRKGSVLDAPAVQEQLAQALAVSEKESGVEIEDVFLAVTGGHIGSTTNVGNAPVQSPDRIITEEEVVTAVRNARSCRPPPEQSHINSIDRRFLVDDVREVANPIGQVGSRLQAEVHMIYGDRGAVETARTLVAEVLGYRETARAFSAVADTFALFSEEEQRRGSLVVDIGAGVTEYAVFHGPGCFHSSQIAVGCEHVVNDLAVAFRLPVPRAAGILHNLGDFGSAVTRPDGRKRLVEVETSSGKSRRIPASTIEQVIELRLRELFEVVAADLKKTDAFQRVSNGVVLCGGGARVPGIVRLARQVFQMPVRVGTPYLAGGPREVIANPGFVTAIGLLRFGRKVREIDRESPGLLEQLRIDGHRILNLAKRAFRW
ncbi:MAG: cell division protein FtsA [Kiritimatiellaeota bacterium]|nr:cell division protein FtsA [Kiritimatiellota bacterium]